MDRVHRIFALRHFCVAARSHNFSFPRNAYYFTRSGKFCFLLHSQTASPHLFGEYDYALRIHYFETTATPVRFYHHCSEAVTLQARRNKISYSFFLHRPYYAISRATRFMRTSQKVTSSHVAYNAPTNRLMKFTTVQSRPTHIATLFPDVTHS